jgi:putative ABC transport system permease protein
MTSSLLLRSLWTRGGRAGLAVAGVATSMLLVVSLMAVFRGAREAMASYAGQSDVDLWVASPGSDNLVRGAFSSLLPLSTADTLVDVSGVASAQPILRVFLTAVAPDGQGGERRLTLLAIGYTAPDGYGGPPVLAEGAAPLEPDEVALDRAAAHRLHVGVGSHVTLAGRDVVVSGLTRGTNILATQFVFADYEAASQAMNARGQASFFLVTLDRGVDPAAVALEIKRRQPDVDVFTRAQFVAANDREVVSGFLPLLGLITVLGVSAAAVLVGLLVHSVVEARRADVAVLLALGAGVRSIGLAVLLDAGGLVLAGAALGVGGALALASVVDRWAPTIPLVPAWGDAAGAAAALLAVGLLAALGPVARQRQVDPLEAFRS